MVPLWKVKVLCLGEFAVDKSLETLNKDIGIEMNIPVLSIALFSDEGRGIVDTGISDPDWVNNCIAPYKQSRDQSMRTYLKEGLGWDPTDVDFVINTHLHHDHCGNNMLFTNARFYIQRAEWEFAFSPLPIHEIIYRQEYFGKRAVDYFRLQVLDGEADILPGIKVFPTPGHTRGHQSVLVNTSGGPLCIAGDACNLVENVEEMIPPGITTSVEQALESLKEIRIRARTIIPGHDPCISHLQVDAFPQIK